MAWDGRRRSRRGMVGGGHGAMVSGVMAWDGRRRSWRGMVSLSARFTDPRAQAAVVKAQAQPLGATGGGGRGHRLAGGVLDERVAALERPLRVMGGQREGQPVKLSPAPVPVGGAGSRGAAGEREQVEGVPLAP